ncbi:MAG: serine/threonine-protein kinase [Isosphaeraceae bacterium]
MVKLEMAKSDAHFVDSPGCTTFDRPQRVGDYEILEEIGKGGMGIVYKAKQDGLGRLVALKVLPPFSNIGRSRDRFLREMKVVSRLHHTHIVPLFAFGEENGLLYYAMQLIEGNGLDRLIARWKQLESPPDHGTSTGSVVPHAGATGAAFAPTITKNRNPTSPPDLSVDPAHSTTETQATPTHGGSAGKAQISSADEQADSNSAPDVTLNSQRLRPAPGSESFYRWVATIGIAIGDAVAHAHKLKILHRDIKPANILIDNEGAAWLTDFGLAKSHDDSLTGSGGLAGTARYMAPEQVAGNPLDRSSDCRSDLYSLGLTLYEMLTYTPAFPEEHIPTVYEQIRKVEPKRPRELVAAIPLDLESVILKASDKEPSRRYQTASKLVEDLRRFLNDEPVQARPISHLERSWRWVRRNRMIVAPAALAFLFLIAGTSISTWQWILARRYAAESKATLEFVTDEMLNPPGLTDPWETSTLDFVAAVRSAEGAIPSRLAIHPLGQAQVYFQTAQIYLRAADNQGAIKCLKRALQIQTSHLGPDHIETLRTQRELAVAIGRRGDPGDLDKAHDLLTKTHHSLVDRFGFDHPFSLDTTRILADLYRNRGRPEEAIRLLERAIPVFERRIGTIHDDTLKAYNSLALAYSDAGRHAEAIALFRRTLALGREIPSFDIQDAWIVRKNFTNALHYAGKHTYALQLREDTLREVSSNPDAGPTKQHDARVLLAEAYMRAGRLREAESLCLQWRDEALKRFGPNDPVYLSGILFQLGEIALLEGRWKDAERFSRECLTIRDRVDPNRYVQFLTKTQIGESLVGQKRFDEAESLILEGYAGLRERQRQIPSDDDRKLILAQAAGRVIRLYAALLYHENWSQPRHLADWQRRLSLVAHRANPAVNR